MLVRAVTGLDRFRQHGSNRPRAYASINQADLHAQRHGPSLKLSSIPPTIHTLYHGTNEPQTRFIRLVCNTQLHAEGVGWILPCPFLQPWMEHVGEHFLKKKVGLIDFAYHNNYEVESADAETSSMRLS